uniref:Uncharacterized protein n=1 Tax=Globodera rostochiensis TaxID=31243 RepID=A0A914HXJ6_GLORO
MLFELFLFLFSIYTATAVDLNWPNGEIDQLYSKLLNLPIEHNAKGYIIDENLTKMELLKLELAFFYNASEKIFVSMKDAKFTNVQEKLIEEKRGQFDDLMESVKMEERSTEVNKCKLWKFWRNLQDFFVEKELMDSELAKITNNKDKLEPNLIDCEQIEQILAKNERENAEGKDAEMVGIQIYLQDTKMLTHYHALMHLLTAAQKPESVEDNIEWVWYREFVDVFSTKKLDFESNVGYQLRKMRFQNDAKGIVEFKSEVERLMGPNLLAELEVRQPFLMALDLTTNAQLAADYGKGALFRLQQFLFPKSMDKLMEEYSEMKEIMRIKLEDDDIAKLQTVNYIIFFDVNSDVKMWKRAQFLLDILANYQWYKWHLKSLSKAQQNIMEQNLAKMEICMDSINEFSNLDKMEETRVEFLNNFYEFRKKMFPNEKTFVSGFEVLSKNAETDILYKTFSMHEKSLSPLLGNDEFKQKLEEIYIDAERFDGKLHNNSTIFSNLFKHCRGVLNTKEDKEWYELLKQYEALLQTADPLTDSEKKMFNVDTLTFKLRDLLKELLNFGRNLKSKNNKKFTQIVIQAAVDVANLGLLVENDNLNEKLRQKCYFESVFGWLKKNGTLLKNAEWRKYVLHRGFISKDQIPEPSESDLRWSKPDCENNLDPKKLMQEWTEDSECAAHHATFIHDLNQRFPNFYKNVAANILSFPKFRNFATLGEEEEIELYKVILGSDDAKMAREAESRMANRSGALSNCILCHLFE